MTIRLAFLITASSIVACAHPMPTPPAPTTLTSPLAPAQVIQRSAAALTVQGFAITTSDATAGVLTATNEREATSMAPEINCYYGPDAVGAKGTRLILRVSVSAVPSAVGSSVTINSRVQQIEGAGGASISRRLGTTSHTDDACASTGEVEKRLAAQLAAR